MAENIIGERIVMLRNRMGLSQTAFGKRLDYSRSQIGRFEYGLSKPSDSLLEKIAALCGTHLAYLRGETDIADPTLYWASEEAAADEAVDQYFAELEATDRSRKHLFASCGYFYENLEQTAAWCFADVDGSPMAAGPHKLMPFSGGEAVYFSEEDLTALIDRLRMMVDYECFCQKKKEGATHGDDSQT